MAIVSKNCEDAVNAVNCKRNLDSGELGGDDDKSSGLVSPLDQLLNALSQLMQTENRRMTCQNAALKYLPSILPSLLHYHLYPAIHLAGYISQLVIHFSAQIVPRQKLVFLQEIVQTEIFACLNSRQLLLPLFLNQLLLFLPPPENTADSLELAHLAAKVLTEIIERLFPYSQSQTVFQRGTSEELKLILFHCFRPTNQTVVFLFNCGLPSIGTCQRVVHSLLLALLDKFSAANFLEYFTGQLERRSARATQETGGNACGVVSDEAFAAQIVDQTYRGGLGIQNPPWTENRFTSRLQLRNIRTKVQSELNKKQFH
uniref:Neurofibromin n=1 Tax=Ditylenchus dipsaci TaxID=166011 RepID=A0A915E011_9BILA